MEFTAALSLLVIFLLLLEKGLDWRHRDKFAGRWILLVEDPLSISRSPLEKHFDVENSWFRRRLKFGIEDDAENPGPLSAMEVDFSPVFDRDVEKRPRDFPLEKQSIYFFGKFSVQRNSETETGQVFLAGTRGEEVFRGFFYLHDSSFAARLVRHEDESNYLEMKRALTEQLNNPEDLEELLETRGAGAPVARSIAT